MLFLGRGFDPARKDEEKAELEDLLQARDKKFHLSPIITSQIASPARRYVILVSFTWICCLLASSHPDGEACCFCSFSSSGYLPGGILSAVLSHQEVRARVIPRSLQAYSQGKNLCDRGSSVRLPLSVPRHSMLGPIKFTMSKRTKLISTLNI
jgi:hypothetical protein